MPQVDKQVVIDAPIERVYAIAKDLTSFPKFMSDVESITIVEQAEDGSRVVADWVGVVSDFKLKVRWTEEDVWDDAVHRSQFRQVKGDYQEYHGSWAFQATAEGGTRIDSTLIYEIEIPLVGPLLKRVIAKLVDENCERLLTAIKQEAEKGPS
jgi:uncharacterized membrane protein